MYHGNVFIVTNLWSSLKFRKALMSTITAQTVVKLGRHSISKLSGNLFYRKLWGKLYTVLAVPLICMAAACHGTMVVGIASPW